MKQPQPREVMIGSVNLVWYAVALAPIVALFLASLYGYLPPLFAMISLFLLFFWLFSFAFAVYAKRRKPKDLRQ